MDNTQLVKIYQILAKMGTDGVDCDKIVAYGHLALHNHMVFRLLHDYNDLKLNCLRQEIRRKLDEYILALETENF